MVLNEYIRILEYLSTVDVHEQGLSLFEGVADDQELCFPVVNQELLPDRFDDRRR